MQKATTALDVGGVEHDADASTESMWRDVVSEFCFYYTRVTVRTCDSSPDDSHFRSLNSLLPSVDIGDTLSKVELGIRRRGGSFNLEETGVGSRIPLASFISEYAAFGVESGRRHP